MALSAIARLMKKNAFEEFGEFGRPKGRRTSSRLPARKGMARGSLGTSGSRPLQDRNPDASDDEDRRTMQSSVMDAFIKRHTG